MNKRIRNGCGVLAVATAMVAVTVGLAVFRRSNDSGVRPVERLDPGRGAAPASSGDHGVEPGGEGPALAGPTAVDGSVGRGDPNRPLPNALRPLVEAAIQRLETETDPTRHRESLEEALSRIRDADLGLALAVLTDPAFSMSGRELRQRLLERWGANDPQAAVAWIGRMSAGEAREEALGDVARGWASRDLDAARAWALGLPEPSERDGALIQVAYELARSRPVEAMQLAIEMQPTVQRDEVLSHSATQWAAQSPGDAVDWALQVADEGLRTRLLRNILTEWGDRDPMKAATAAVKSMPEGRDQSDTVVGIVQRWTQTDPATASAWVSAFPDGELREAAGRELVTIWADQDVATAGQWLDTLPAGGFRDTAVSAYVEKILPSAPETAADWAMQIADPTRRAGELERVGSGWLESDAPAARAWIAGSALSAEAKARLLAPSQPSGPVQDPGPSAGSPPGPKGGGRGAGS